MMLLSVGLGLSLVVLAAPRSIVETALAVVQPVLLSIERDPDGPAARFEIAHRLIDPASALAIGGRASEYAGRLSAAEARRAPGETAVAHSLEAARQFAHALTAAPMESWTWYRYTHALYATHQYIEAAHAWRMSVETGLVDYQMMYPRVQAGLALWPYMDVPARDAFGRQIIALWRWEPSGLARQLHKFGGGAAGLQALAPWPHVQKDMGERLDWLARQTK